MVGLPSTPYPPAPASFPAYLVPLQLPVVTPVLRHDPCLTAAGERPITASNDERVVGVALLNAVLLAKARRKTTECQSAIRNVVGETPPDSGHERLADKFPRFFKLFLQPLPVQTFVTFLVQQGEVVRAVAATLRPLADVVQVDFLSSYRLAAQLADALLPRHDVSLDVDVAEHWTLLVADALNVGVQRRLDVELSNLHNSLCYRDEPRPHPPKVDVRQVLALDGRWILTDAPAPVVEPRLPVPQPASTLSAVHHPFGQPIGRGVPRLAGLLLQGPPKVLPFGLRAHYSVAYVTVSRVDAERHFRRVFGSLFRQLYRERVVTDDPRPPAADHGFRLSYLGRRERHPVPV